MKMIKPSTLVNIIILLLVVASSTAFGFMGGGGPASWKEEVLLHDGTKIVVERSQTRGGRGEVGQSPIREQSIKFTLPGSNKNITWKDEYSKDVGHSNFDLLALQILNGTPYIAVSPYGCLAYNKWDRPNPPYVFFMFDGNVWQRISLSDSPPEFNEANLVINASAHEKKLVSQGFVSAVMIRKLNSSLSKQEQFKVIMREPLKPGSAGVSCPESVYHKGAWVSPGDSIGRRMMDRKIK
jgi:hypothetical protein